MLYSEILKLAGIDVDKLREYTKLCEDNKAMNAELERIWRSEEEYARNPVAFYYDNLLYSTQNIMRYPLDEEISLEKIANMNRESYIYDIARLFRYTHKSVLDYGCGIGQNGFTFAHFGYDVTLSDVLSPSFRAVETLCDGIAFGVTTIPLTENSIKILQCNTHRTYDIIICTQVLEHVKDPEAHLECFYGHLSKNGLLILEVFFDDCSGRAPYHLHENNKYGDVNLWQSILIQNGFYPLMAWDSGEWRLLHKRFY